MTKTKKFLWATIICCVIVMVATAGVIYGVVTHDEDPALYACWDDTGIAVYDCNNPSRVQWKQKVPLQVTTIRRDKSPASDWQKYLVKAGTDIINKQVGCPVFVDDPDAPTLMVEFGHPQEANDPIASCRHISTDGVMAHKAVITVRNVSDDASAATIITHELGHAAGLGHSEDQSSVMRPIQPDDLIPGMPVLRLTDASKRYLQERFCHD